MGSLEVPESRKNEKSEKWLPVKRPSFSKHRAKMERSLRFEKIDYLQWICSILVFLSVVILFQAYLPTSVVEKSDGQESIKGMMELGNLSFGEGVKFAPCKILKKLEKEKNNGSLGIGGMRLRLRTPVRKPQIAIVFADLMMDDLQLLMFSVFSSLRELGYAIQVFSVVDGPVHAIWSEENINVTILQGVNKSGIAVDWLNYDAVLANSLRVRGVVSNLMQEPFKSIPVIWTIHEEILSPQAMGNTSDEDSKFLHEWKQVFARATVVVFPNYLFTMAYAAFDSGNFFVSPGSPIEPWETATFMAVNTGQNMRVGMGYMPEDFIVVIIGSEFLYNGIWLEHALLLKALIPLLAEFQAGGATNSCLKIAVISGTSKTTYQVSLQAIALKLGYPIANVRHFGNDEDVSSLLNMSDLVIYGTLREEQSFPSLLLRAMCFGKPVIAPNLEMINKYINNKVNGYLFPKKNPGLLTEALFEAVQNGKLSRAAQTIASKGKKSATNLLVFEAVEGYASVVETIIQFPSEVAYPKSVDEIPQRLKEEWQWKLANKMEFNHWKRRSRSPHFFVLVKGFQNDSYVVGAETPRNTIDEAFSLTDWEEQKSIEMANARKRREDEELKDRTDQPRGTWEEVYRSAKRIDRAKNELHERDDRELERIGQLLCIYEPYFGEGAWPFLHQKSLYRGIGMSTKGRRPGADDVDGPSRLSILSNAYYRDALAEYGAFFSIANRVDRIHKNAWIGSQSWRATAMGVSLTETAEIALLNAIQTHKHGDALYFWARLDKDSRNPSQMDFWSFCDAVNAGNCRFAVSRALRRMYGVSEDFDSLPPMPGDSGTWSMMHSWAMPTRSFLEMVMFARMFVDALDAEIYDEHRRTMQCYLSTKKDRRCYERLLEVVVNIWAYHSTRRLVYVNPRTGDMEEQHGFPTRRSRMWVRWFSFWMLKSMDEELAEESDSDHPGRRWLWPLTGEVFWQGRHDLEENKRHQQKAERKQKSKDKIRRIKSRQHQKTLGKYIKPPPEEVSNATTVR